MVTEGAEYLGGAVGRWPELTTIRTPAACTVRAGFILSPGLGREVQLTTTHPVWGYPRGKERGGLGRPKNRGQEKNTKSIFEQKNAPSAGPKQFVGNTPGEGGVVSELSPPPLLPREEPTVHKMEPGPEA